MKRNLNQELEENRQAADEFLGWCEACQDYTRECTEPDVQIKHGYYCPICHQHVIGADTRLFQLDVD